jgi:hypothetical protein
LPEEITLEFIARQLEQMSNELAELRAEIRTITDETQGFNLEMGARPFHRVTPPATRILDW